MKKNEFESILNKHNDWLNSRCGIRAVFKNDEIPAEYLSNRVFDSVIFKSIRFIGNIYNAQFINCVFDDCNICTSGEFILINCDITDVSIPSYSAGIIIF